MVSFDPAVACYFCLSLPAALTQLGQSLLADPSSTATHVLVNGRGGGCGAQAQSKWDFAPLIIIDMTESGKDGGRAGAADGDAAEK